MPFPQKLLIPKSTASTKSMKNICIYQSVFRKKSSTSYKDSLFLPKTTFSHKVKSVEVRKREEEIFKASGFSNAYQDINERNSKKLFILHDGPPYANGNVHIGHAVNKILKDITVRYWAQLGHPVNFKNGWDCHGLPIELKVLKKEQSVAPLDLRKKAHAFSLETKARQLKSFSSWGLMTDWNDTYYTCHSDYIVQQLIVFQQLYDKGLIIRDHKPVFWSPYNKTSLAEAELEYNPNHISSSVYVKFRVQRCPSCILHNIDFGYHLYILIWTTTPWSLPANQAVCYSPREKYCIVYCNTRKEYYLVALGAVSSLERTLNASLQVKESFESSMLSEMSYAHPVWETKQECPVIASEHVTLEKGSGLVHSAPNHGLEDYSAALKHSIAIQECLVDESGRFTCDAGSNLAGLPVLDEGSTRVVELLGENVLHKEDYLHSYPYDWRVKAPVILRSSPQWFLNIQAIRQRAMECLDTVKVIPNHWKKAFQSQLESSPPWCISRQRAWGVPIPAFYHPGEKLPLVHRDLTHHLCSLIREKGIHAWWSCNIQEILTPNLKNRLKIHDDVLYEKGMDIMDIWFDSGISWNNILPEPKVSDICIEGVDQIRGWFNSSLLTSVALRDKAPYTTLFLHGFVTDAEGRKMSKSVGNVVSPQDIQFGTQDQPGYGIDVLRWWVASHASHAENIPFRKNVLEECAQSINKIRNVLKFLIGCVDLSSNASAAEQMCALDLYMLHSVRTFSQKIDEFFSAMQFKSAAKELQNFVVNDVSAFYCHLVKDRLYCNEYRSSDRRSCITALSYILNSLMNALWPICPHLSEEVRLHLPKGFDVSDVNQFLLGTATPECFSYALQVRQAIAKNEVKTINMNAYISGPQTILQHLQDLNRGFSDTCGVSEFFQTADFHFHPPKTFLSNSLSIRGVLHPTGEKYEVILCKTDKTKCPRCRLYRTHADNCLCERCANVLRVSSDRSFISE